MANRFIKNSQNQTKFEGEKIAYRSAWSDEIDRLLQVEYLDNTIQTKYKI